MEDYKQDPQAGSDDETARPESTVRQYYGLIVLATLILTVYAWASKQPLFTVVDGVLPL
jgi:hypothetical protein